MLEILDTSASQTGLRLGLIDPELVAKHQPD